MNKIIGIDASTKSTGYVVFVANKIITYGKISKDFEDDNWRKRIIYMCKEIIKIIKEYGIDTMVVETPVKTIANVNTLEQLFVLNGALMAVASMLNINFIPVDVNQWRKKVGILRDIPKDTKNKRAILKERSVNMANELYNLDLVWKSATSKYNDDDISDAILLTHSIIT
jgi:hypothetical protein